MFLPKLFRHNKLLFLFFICYAFAQLFINVKRGLVATPFLHYGMYSGYMGRANEIDIWEVEVNREKISLIDYNGKIADQVIEPLRLYEQLGNSNLLYHSHISRFLQPFHLAFDSTAFVCHLANKDFIRWYKNHLSKIIGKNIYELRVFKNSYLVKGSNFHRAKQSLIFYENE